MSKDYREQSQLEDDADEKYLTMYQYYKELTDFERGEYDALHSYPFDESEEDEDEVEEEELVEVEDEDDTTFDL